MGPLEGAKQSKKGTLQGSFWGWLKNPRIGVLHDGE